MPIKSKTPEQLRAERAAEIDAIQAMQADHEARRADWQQEHDAFAARVHASRDAIDTYIHRNVVERANESMSASQLDALREQIKQEAYAQVRPTIKPLEQLYAEDTAARLAAEAEAEAERARSLSNKDIWLSMQSPAEQARIARWEHIKKVPYPIPVSQLAAIKVARTAEQETP